MPHKTDGGARRNPVFDYSLALLITAGAILIRAAFPPWLDAAMPFLTCFLAAIYLAYSRGLWPALLSIVVSAGAGTYYVFGTQYSGTVGLWASERVAIVGFVIVSITISLLVDFQRRTLNRARAAETAQRAIAEDNALLLSEAEQAAKELVTANKELQQANEDLEAFAWSLSHDLKEPLRTISLYAELLGKKAWPEADTQIVNEIRSAARRSLCMIQDMLDYARVVRAESGSPPIVDANSVVSGVLDTLRPSISEAGATITVSDLPNVAIHPTRLSQVFQNLISNALKYRTGEELEICVSAQARDIFWIFSVQDNGIGIDPRYAEQIFAVFKRLHTQHVYPGTGIGLAICRRIVEQYGGRIWLERSALQAGSVFCFSLPREPAMIAD